MSSTTVKQQLIEYIDEKVDQKIISLSKVPGYKIDKEKIQEECKKEVFAEIAQESKKQEEGRKEFQNQVQQDDPNLSLKLLDREKLTEVKPERPQIEHLREMGMMWFDKGDWNKSYYYFIFLSQVDAENPVTWLLRGMSEHNLKQFKDAIVSYTLALAFAPNYMYAHIQLIKGLIESGKIEEAKQRLEKFNQTFQPSQYENDAFIVSELKKIKPYLM